MGGEILSEILPYLEVNQANQEELETIEQIETPNIIGMTVEEAKKVLKESELNISIKSSEKEINESQTLIINQMPTAGIIINKNSNVFVETRD